jgi:hypothetical protein
LVVSRDIRHCLRGAAEYVPRVRASVLIVLAACSRASSPLLDSGSQRDAPPPAIDAPAAIDAPPGAYRHTIALDGNDDFVGTEMFATTSTGYTARVTWDDANVYVGYSGPDLDPTALDASFKWVFAYFDVDPGAATGATASLTYNTQQATFPTGFGAELYARWKCDTSFASIEQREANGTYTMIATPTSGHAGAFVELAVPRALLGTSQAIGVVTWMINEKPDFEGSFAGLYAGNFADGYNAQLPLTHYLRIDFTATRVPNDPANEAP